MTPRRFSSVGIGVVSGVVVAIDVASHEDSAQSARDEARQVAAQKAQQVQEAQLEQEDARRQAALPRAKVVVVRTNVSARTPLNPSDFELSEVPADSVRSDAVTSLGDLQEKVLSVPVQAGQRLSAYSLYEPSELTATAEIVAAKIDPTNVKVGDTLTIKITVKNTSDITLRTMGPEPGFTYTQGQNLRSTSCNGQQCFPPPRQYATWRVAVGSPALDATDELLYRWGLGGELEPGATTTVSGQIKINRYFEPTHFWVALIQEPDKVVQNVAGMTVVTSLPENTVDRPGR